MRWRWAHVRPAPLGPSQPAPAGERGYVGGVEVLPFGLLVFVTGSLLIANAWAVVDAKLAVTDAAREGARAYVEAPEQATAETAARDAARTALTAHGRDADRAEITDDHPAFARCSRVTVVVRYTVPAVSMPFVGGFGHGSTVRARASEVIDPFADGRAEAAPCAG